MDPEASATPLCCYYFLVFSKNNYALTHIFLNAEMSSIEPELNKRPMDTFIITTVHRSSSWAINGWYIIPYYLH